MKDGRKSDYFDTKYMAVLQIEQILHNFEDQNFANFYNLEQVNFRRTLVNFYVTKSPLFVMDFLKCIIIIYNKNLL